MTSQAPHKEMIERVVRTVEANTSGSGPDAIDAAHIRVILCVNSGYPVEQVNQAIATTLEQGQLTEHDKKGAMLLLRDTVAISRRTLRGSRGGSRAISEQGRSLGSSIKWFNSVSVFSMRLF